MDGPGIFHPFHMRCVDVLPERERLSLPPVAPSWAIVVAAIPATSQTSMEAGPTSLAPKAAATYMSAPTMEPTTRLVTSKALNFLPSCGFFGMFPVYPVPFACQPGGVIGIKIRSGVSQDSSIVWPCQPFLGVGSVQGSLVCPVHMCRPQVSLLLSGLSESQFLHRWF